MAPPLIVRAILDVKSYLTNANSVNTANIGMGDTALAMGTDFTKSAEAQVAAGVKVIQSQRIQVAEYGKLAAAATAGSDAAIVAAARRDKAQAALNRSLGISTVASAQFGAEAKKGERDLGKLTRGALAGSGVFSKLGRSLAFASSGFIAVAGGATVIAESIRQAEALGVAQRQVDRQLQTSGKSWATYGSTIDKVLLKEGHLAGFTRSQLLQAFGYLLRVGGNVQKSLNLTGLAADVARGRSISLQAASIALSKALGGSVTALRRLGIIVPNNVTKMQALEYVQKKFAGQAEAGTSASQRLSASLTDAGATIGTVLLPTFDRLATKFGDWLQRMNESGKLTRDVSSVTSALGIVFHTVGKAIETVDKVTGGFGKTLVLVGEIWAGIKIAGWITSLRALAVEWGVVGAAAAGAGAAEAAAIGVGGAAATSGVVARINEYTGAGALGATASGTSSKIARLTSNIGLLGVAAVIAIPYLKRLQHGASKTIGDTVGGTARSIYDYSTGFVSGGVIGKNPVDLLFGGGSHGGYPGVPNFGQLPPVLGGPSPSLGPGMRGRDGAIFGGATHVVQIPNFQLDAQEQLQAAQASLTRGSQDDVAAAKQVVARIKRLINKGRLHGNELTAALQAEASALGTIWSAEDAAAQKRAAAAQAAKQKIITQIQNAIDPINLQIAFAKAESLGQNTTAVLRQQLAAAYNGLAKAIANGNKQLILQAYQQIKSIKDALKSAATAVTSQFTVSPKLALDIARDQALGKGITDDLREEKKALKKWIASHRKNIQGVTDAYNQIAAINGQLNSNATNAYGDYKKASLKAETAGLGLTPEQRRALEARLSQLGPGGTHPMSGTGAAGYVIDPETGRPIHRGRHQGSRYTGGGSNTPTINAKFDLNVWIDGKQVETVVTKRQQRNNTRRPTQRRGPNAATR